MKKVTAEELEKIIENHGKWLRDEAGGARADLSGACLSRADLTGANPGRDPEPDTELIPAVEMIPAAEAEPDLREGAWKEDEK